MYFWVEDGAQVSQSELQALSDAFDNTIYDSVRALGAAKPSPALTATRAYMAYSRMEWAPSVNQVAYPFAIPIRALSSQPAMNMRCSFSISMESVVMFRT